MTLIDREIPMPARRAARKRYPEADAGNLDQPLAARRCLLIVPAFNEGNSVTQVVVRLQRAVPEADVLVIDDGSTDDTARKAMGRAHMVSLPFNLGIGGAMQTGYRYADMHGYDFAVQVDGDGQHRPREVRRLIEELTSSDVDLVVGSRFLGVGAYQQQPARLLGGWTLRLMLRWLTGLAVTDCTSGFRAANRRVIRAFAHWYPEDYPEPEVILLLHRAGFRIREIPVTMRQRRGGRSSIAGISGLFYVVKVATCLMLDMARQPWNNGKVNGL